MKSMDMKKTVLTKSKYILIPFWLIVGLTVLSTSVSNISLINFSLDRSISLWLPFNIFLSQLMLLCLAFFFHINILKKKLWAYLIMLILMIYVSFYVPHLALFSVYGLLHSNTRKEIFSKYNNEVAKEFINKGHFYVISFLFISFILFIAVKYVFVYEIVKANEVIVVTTKSKKIEKIITGPVKVRLTPFIEESVVFPLTIELDAYIENNIQKYIFKITNPRRFYIASNGGNVSFFKSSFKMKLEKNNYKNVYTFKKDLEHYGLELINRVNID
jgi:hypothetical protein